MRVATMTMAQTQDGISTRGKQNYDSEGYFTGGILSISVDSFDWFYIPTHIC